VKQSDLDEYEENVRGKQNIQYTRQGTNSPLKPRQITSSPSNQAIWVANIKFQIQEGSNQNMKFLNVKDHTLPEPKAKHNKRQIQQRRQLSLKTSIGHLNNKASQSTYDLGTKGTRVRIVINDHKQNPLAIHKKKNMDHKGNSSHNRGKNQPTESHIYTGDEHHDKTNMGHNQNIVTQSGEQIKPQKKQEQSNQCTPQVANKSSCTRSKIQDRAIIIHAMRSSETRAISHFNQA
jgi:hypothetical protein